MSEYQYYEFQAIDRPLTKEEMADLRALSSRATITSTRLQNVYHYGDFRGDPLKLMERYFDVHVYVANWGTNQLMLRLPRQLLDLEVVRQYCVCEGVDIHLKGDYAIFDLVANDDEGGGWIADEEAEAWLPSLLPIREEIANGDLRALYIAWLGSIGHGEIEDEEIEDEDEDDTVEPPVPPGLGQLSAAQQSLVEFLGVGEDLVAAAAQRSEKLVARREDLEGLEAWVRRLAVAEKDELLVRLAQGNAAQVRAEVLARFRKEIAATEARTRPQEAGRTVAELLAAAAEEERRREQREAERKARERAAYLDDLAKREEAVWGEVERLVNGTQTRRYELATQLLMDLHDLAARRRTQVAFESRLAALRERYAKRATFVSRLRQAGLA